ncbi:hypothetical protein LINPERHAP1_LOCUS24580 [Linum perenne]
MAAAFSWRSRFIMDGRIVEGPVEGSRPVLSPVRTGTDDNCLPRSHCDAWDAMARIQTAGRADFFEERFSVERLVQRIIYLKTSTSNSWQFLDYFIREGNRVPPRAPLPLPTYRNQGIQFRLEWYRLLRVNSDTEDINYNVEGAVTLVMEHLREKGPLVEVHIVSWDYLFGGIFCTPLSNRGFEGHPNLPIPIPDPMPRTPTDSPPNSPPPNPPLMPPRVLPPQVPPPPRRIPKYHAVSIVGYYTTELGEVVFEVQDSQGANFIDGGFRHVASSLFKKFFFSTILPIDRSSHYKKQKI